MHIEQVSLYVIALNPLISHVENEDGCLFVIIVVMGWYLFN